MVGALRRWWRLGAVGVVFVAAAITATVVGLPDVDQFRQWSSSIGPGFVILFLVVHAVVCVAPIPRTIFTLASGVLFGPVLGLVVAVVASTASATGAFLLVRALGRETVAARLTHPAVTAVNTRLERRGWLAVGSLRMIAPVPFSIINYCAGLSAVRLLPFVAATVVGILPGTVSIVILGSVIGGGANPWGLVVSVAGVCLGLVGMALDARLPVATPDKLEPLSDDNQASGIDDKTATPRP
ncbi:TVP38/TMEM64 family protein [Williamsia herbipolensis]|uniref:TVP38/TMEM64 family membrane protein n=1 Tax=Williamsia herbipolensis TaxID=1603258 RepID=A0AAU4K3X8_9NOCA|nr:TVP38/TMEM64 family protein [Williamsia herbipolensis]